jgi:hypothetical protein
MEYHIKLSSTLFQNTLKYRALQYNILHKLQYILKKIHFNKTRVL